MLTPDIVTHVKLVCWDDWFCDVFLFLVKVVKRKKKTLTEQSIIVLVWLSHQVSGKILSLPYSTFSSMFSFRDRLSDSLSTAQLSSKGVLYLWVRAPCPFPVDLTSCSALQSACFGPERSRQWRPDWRSRHKSEWWLRRSSGRDCWNPWQREREQLVLFRFKILLDNKQWHICWTIKQINE